MVVPSLKSEGELDIRERVKARMRWTLRTNQSLAKRVGCSPSHLSRALHGRRSKGSLLEVGMSDDLRVKLEDWLRASRGTTGEVNTAPWKILGQSLRGNQLVEDVIDNALVCLYEWTKYSQPSGSTGPVGKSMHHFAMGFSGETPENASHRLHEEGLKRARAFCGNLIAVRNRMETRRKVSLATLLQEYIDLNMYLNIER